MSVTSLNGTNGFRLDGTETYAYSGRSVAGIGDVNGDGFADFAIGQFASNSGKGLTFVVFGTGAAGSPVATYKSVTGPGNTAKKPVGMSVHGVDAIPSSRVWLDFNGGASASTETATLMRTNTGVSNLQPIADVANVVWEVTSTRTGWSNAKITLKYTDAETSAITGGESALAIFKAPSLSGPWTKLTTTVRARR